MDLVERAAMLILGGIIGFIAGYLVRSLREIKDDVHDVKEELHEVDEIVKHKLSGDDGFMAHRYVADVLMVVVLVIVAWSAFASQAATNTSKKNGDCTMQYLDRTIVALNERTTYTQEQAEANVELQKAQAEFLALLLRRPPYPEAKRTEAAQNYLQTLTDFATVSTKNVNAIAQNPYPTPEDFQSCLND